jgi:hypothetical protein
VEGHEEAGPWLPPVGHSSGGTATADSGSTVACVDVACVHTMASGAGSLMSGARLAAGGFGACVGRPRKEMEWAKPRENTKSTGPG